MLTLTTSEGTSIEIKRARDTVEIRAVDKWGATTGANLTRETFAAIVANGSAIDALFDQSETQPEGEPES